LSLQVGLHAPEDLFGLVLGPALCAEGARHPAEDARRHRERDPNGEAGPVRAQRLHFLDEAVTGSDPDRPFQPATSMQRSMVPMLPSLPGRPSVNQRPRP
jgi:hypothetical protein